ncbi:hypothetical protein [Bacillus badius]|uniref:Uncharacterized protein n=1 Tax=Bacillus badius TaxID=1455 RepID=A0ABR5ANM6_BACBA|nr:hypothetical protein [Bacillus badius]KIL72037.1 hypothetical protein SD77_3597 [Bacillus badius]MED4718262.1 hypothetical protein [Bacillus badius]
MHLLLIIAPAFIVGLALLSIAQAEANKRVREAYKAGLREGREQNWREAK